MSWITVVWSMIVSTCLTLALVHLVIWLRQTDEFAHLLFSILAISVAAIAVCELLSMYARDPEQYGRIIWWAHIPVFFAVVSIVGFVRLFFHAGRVWLGFSACALRLLDLTMNFFSVPNVTYLQITGLRHSRFLGETVSIARGLENPLNRVLELSSLLLLLFVIDASATLWRRGQPNDRRRAVVVGGSIIFFVLVAAGLSALIEAGLILSPYMISPSFLAIVLAMGYELSSDTVRAARLGRQLQVSEGALRESEARFRVLADTAPVMVWMSGPDMLCDFFNKQWLEFTGRTIQQELGNGWSEGVHAEDLHACRETYTSSFRARQTFSIEYRLRRADGEYRWILDTGVPRYTPQGGFAGYIGSAIDITDRRKAEVALRESEQNMSLAAESAEMVMWMWDIQRDEVWTTDNGRAFLGYAKSEKISFEKFLSTVHPEDRDAVREGVMKAVNGAGEYDGEYRVVVAGQTLWLAGRGRVEFDCGQPIRMRGASLDITLRKQAEERFRVVVEAAPNAMIVVNSEGRIELINAEVESVFGYNRRELVGQPIEILVPKPSRSGHSGYRESYLVNPKTRAMGAGRELFGRRKDGTEVPVEIGLNPLNTSSGVFVLASIVELTERRKTELELARQRNELAHLSRVALLGELSMSLAHELNQPLTVILSNAQAAQLLLEHEPVDLDELPEILQEIEGQSKRAGEVIRGLRALLKKGETRYVPVDVNKVVDKVLKLIRSDLINQRVAIETDLAPDLPSIAGDEVQLQQVLLNLVVNACDAMGEIETIERKLFICTELRKGRVLQVSVADRGRGIPPAEIEHIFDPFFTTKRTGMGLGLTVCRTIISAHGGEIRATNNPKRGATFQFMLPTIKPDTE